MSRIIGVSLLLILLVDNFYHSTASLAGFHNASKGHILKCGCRVFPKGIKCRVSLSTTKSVKIQDQVKCFCRNQHKFPQFQAACRSRRPTIPITLL